jgi:demethylmenaquinone methyltransferase/2-methoxy-6-polyprenyl-1,4-benzoquinol methylase
MKGPALHIINIVVTWSQFNYLAMFDHFNLLAPLYDRVFQPPDLQQFIRLLELPAEGCLLDAGGGTGRVSNELRPLVDEIVITDISRGMLEQAVSKNGLNVSQAQAEMLPFPEETFSRVIVVDALHHFRDQRGAVLDLIRVLRNGGRLLIQEPDINFWQVKMIAFAEKLALMGSRFYAPVAIKQMAESFGCRAQISAGDKLSSWIIVEK